MAKINKRLVDTAGARARDYVIWDDELPGFGLRVFASGKRSYVIQYRSAGRSRRYTIGLHGVWTPETARREAKVQLGKVAQGDNPVEEKQINRHAMTVKDLCERYVDEMRAGLILGKGGRPKKPSTVGTDIGRINGHIVPLLGQRRVRDLSKADVTKAMNDIIAGKTCSVKKSAKLRGKSILRGGAGAASRCVGVIGSMLTYAISAGVIEHNVAHGIRKPKDRVRDRRLSEDEYRILGEMLRRAGENEKYTITVGIIRQLALTGCRRSEIISLRWNDVDTENSCLRLSESKEGASTRPIGVPVVEFLEEHRLKRTGTFVFPGSAEDNAFGSFSNHWAKIFAASPLADVTAHILRHSFASVANDLGFTESTIAALIGHSTSSVTSKYIHTLDTALIMAADTISGYIQGLLDGVAFKQTAYALDRESRKAALARFLQEAAGEDHAKAEGKAQFAV